MIGWCSVSWMSLNVSQGASAKKRTNRNVLGGVTDDRQQNQSNPLMRERRTRHKATRPKEHSQLQTKEKNHVDP